MERLPSLPDDGLETPEVGEWAEEKYQLVRCYATIFANAMPANWPSLTYVDLFAASGRARIRGTDRIVPSSASVVLDIPKPFSRYILCELDATNVATLTTRTSSRSDRDVRIVAGDCNEEVERIVELIPSDSLTFCFVDPFNLRSLRFETIRSLARRRRADFLVLLATGMDANRNAAEYMKPADKTIENLTGSNEWRDRLVGLRTSFGDLVADEFGLAMKRIEYRYDGLAGTKQIANEKNTPLYRLAFFSKNPLGAKFWDACKKSTDPQRPLF